MDNSRGVIGYAFAPEAIRVLPENVRHEPRGATILTPEAWEDHQNFCRLGARRGADFCTHKPPVYAEI
jgi:hypothetical protein